MLKKKNKKTPSSKKKDRNLNIVEEGVELIEEGIELVEEGVKIVKKRISAFYKINIFISIFISMILFYFIVLVPLNPKTIPQITQRLEKYLRQNFDEKASIENSYMKFTSYGTMKVTIVNLKLNKIDDSLKNQEIIMPKIESEFSLFNIMLFRFLPSKIKIIDPEIIFYVNEGEKLEKEERFSQQKKDFLEFIEPVVGIISSVRSGDIYIKNLEIENAKFTTKIDGKLATRILLKDAKIKVSTKNDDMQIYSSSILQIVGSDRDIEINTNCGLQNKVTRCGLTVNNFAVNSAASLHESLTDLKNINTDLSVMIDFSVAKRKLQNFDFKIQASEGEFNLEKFFSQKFAFKNLSAAGNYDYQLDLLNIAEIKAGLNPVAIKKDEKELIEKKSWPNFEMSVLVSDFRNRKNKDADFYIELENVTSEDVIKFWPINLPKQNIRKWVGDHINKGSIENAYVKFNLKTVDFITKMEKLDSKVNFSGLDVKYSQYFPIVSMASGFAKFSRHNMEIDIAKGKILKSDIVNAKVAISDFSSPVLEIFGDVLGNSTDGLKHAGHNSEFAKHVEEYLNGDAKTNVVIKIPLNKKAELRNVYIEGKTYAQNIKNKFLDGEASFQVKKNFGSKNFSVAADFTKANIHINAFDLMKKIGVDSGAKLIVDANKSGEIKLRNASFYKKGGANISGNAKIDTNSGEINSLYIRNKNFGNNNFMLSYSYKNNYKKLYLKGSRINLDGFLREKFKITDEKSQTSSYFDISLGKIYLRNKKILRNFSVNLRCNKFSLCYQGKIYANYGSKDNFSLEVIKKSKKKPYTFFGKISDIGYLAEGFGISEQISSGAGKFDLAQNIENGKILYKGDVKINNNITFYENAHVKKLEKNTLFSKIKDKIFSNNKTTFDNVKIEFTYQNKIINLESLIANNYKIGITAKGFIDLGSDSYKIKGMIIPGFVINNLFGIGNIPIIGGVISGLLTGGEGGGLFGIKYEYLKNKNDKEPSFTTNAVSAFVPVSIRNLFD